MTSFPHHSRDSRRGEMSFSVSRVSYDVYNFLTLFVSTFVCQQNYWQTVSIIIMRLSAQTNSCIGIMRVNSPGGSTLQYDAGEFYRARATYFLCFLVVITVSDAMFCFFICDVLETHFAPVFVFAWLIISRCCCASHDNTLGKPLLVQSGLIVMLFAVNL